jgi:hypothetical protein
MSVKAARIPYIAPSKTDWAKPVASFDFAKAAIWLAAALLPWAVLYLAARNIF